MRKKFLVYCITCKKNPAVLTGLNAAQILFDKFFAADMVSVAVNVESRGRSDIFQGDSFGGIADLEISFLLALVVSAGEIACDLQNVIISKAGDSVFTVAALVNESIGSVAAPEAVVAFAALQSVVARAAYERIVIFAAVNCNVARDLGGVNFREVVGVECAPSGRFERNGFANRNAVRGAREIRNGFVVFVDERNFFGVPSGIFKSNRAVAKLEDKSTTLVERFYLGYVGGIYMDIFPLDSVPDNKLLRAWHYYRFNLKRRMLYLVYRDPYKHGRGLGSLMLRMLQKMVSKEKAQDS